jgi:hypothetical protein
LGLAASPVTVRLLGGDLSIEAGWPGSGSSAGGAPLLSGASAAHGAPARSGTPAPDGLRVFMTGPAEEVFTCELSDDLLRRLGWPAP